MKVQFWDFFNKAAKLGNISGDAHNWEYDYVPVSQKIVRTSSLEFYGWLSSWALCPDSIQFVMNGFENTSIFSVAPNRILPPY